MMIETISRTNSVRRGYEPMQMLQDSVVLYDDSIQRWGRFASVNRDGVIIFTIRPVSPRGKSDRLQSRDEGKPPLALVLGQNESGLVLVTGPVTSQSVGRNDDQMRDSEPERLRPTYINLSIMTNKGRSYLSVRDHLVVLARLFWAGLSQNLESWLKGLELAILICDFRTGWVKVISSGLFIC